MRILFLGDIVGRPGYTAVVDQLPRLRDAHAIDFVVANAENAADGSGLTVRQFKGLVAAGVDAITMGDHIYRKLELKSTLIEDPRIVKPANFPAASPGRPWTVVRSPGGVDVAVVSLMGRVFMRPVDCPFASADRVLSEIPETVKVRLVDVHAEATSDKQTLARYLDGRVSAVLGTHTHVPTADPQILPAGTAYQTDVGMTGPYDSIIGRDIERVMQTTISFEPIHFFVATGDVRICGALIEIDVQTGRATAIKRFEHALQPPQRHENDSQTET